MPNTTASADATALPNVTTLVADLERLRAAWEEAGDTDESYRLARLHQGFSTLLAVAPCTSLDEVDAKMSFFWSDHLPGADAALQQTILDLKAMGAAR